MRRRLSLLAGGLLTGPLAFLVSFLVDLGAYWLGSLTRRAAALRRGKPD